MTEWQTDFQPTCLPFLLHNHSALNLVNTGHCFEFRVVTAWLYIPCCESRYSLPANSENKGEFSVGFKMTTFGRWERLEHHMGHAGFPNSLRGRWCVWRPSWTALKQLAVTDGPKGCLPLPSGINTFIFSERSSYSSEKSCGEWTGPRALNGTQWTGTQPWSQSQMHQWHFMLMLLLFFSGHAF